MKNIDNDFCHSFPAVRGNQAGRPFYIATCPLRVVPALLKYNEEEVPAELRAQRTLNKARIPEMCRYLVENPDDYVFSAITASISSEALFVESEGFPNNGLLKVPMTAEILVNDGQHRRAAIEEALKIRPELGQDFIAIVFYIDEGLSRSQQMFVDLNQHAVRPSESLYTNFDGRYSSNRVAKYLAQNALPFVGYTDMERSNIPKLSNKIFTLNAIKSATLTLLSKGKKDEINEDEMNEALNYWQSLSNHLIEWKLVQDKKLSVSEFRQEYITAHGIGLQSLANVGKCLLSLPQKEKQSYFKKISKIDWRRANPEWIKRAMLHGKLSKASSNIYLTSIEIKRQIGMSLSEEELIKEKELLNV